MTWWTRFKTAVVDWLDFGPRELPNTEPLSMCGSDTITEHTYDWGHTAIVAGDPRGVFFDLFPEDPEYAAEQQAKCNKKYAPPLNQRRKRSTAKTPKKAPTPAPKARKATKARTTRKKAIPISVSKRGSR